MCPAPGQLCRRCQLPQLQPVCLQPVCLSVLALLSALGGGAGAQHCSYHTQNCLCPGMTGQGPVLVPALCPSCSCPSRQLSTRGTGKEVAVQ